MGKRKEANELIQIVRRVLELEKISEKEQGKYIKELENVYDCCQYLELRHGNEFSITFFLDNLMCEKDNNTNISLKYVNEEIKKTIYGKNFIDTDEEIFKYLERKGYKKLICTEDGEYRKLYAINTNDKVDKKEIKEIMDIYGIETELYQKEFENFFGSVFNGRFILSLKIKGKLVNSVNLYFGQIGESGIEIEKRIKKAMEMGLLDDIYLILKNYLNAELGDYAKTHYITLKCDEIGQVYSDIYELIFLEEGQVYDV